VVSDPAKNDHYPILIEPVLFFIPTIGFDLIVSVADLVRELLLALSSDEGKRGDRGGRGGRGESWS
jgi:hypothetical protein